MGDKKNFAALDWVIGEISETLKDARQALESFVEDPRDSTRMRFCLTHIHQVFGSLQMVEFHGASLLAEEMEHTAQAIINNDVSSANEAQEVLMRAMLQLPTYLDHIKVSKEDHPGVILPLLNDLRAVRKKSFLSETNLFAPNLEAAKPSNEPLHKVTQDPKKLAEVLKKLREMYQFAAASVLRGVSIDENLTFLDKVLTRLELITRGTHCHATWDISAALVDALKRDDLELSVAVRGLLRYLARELRLISENAPETFNRAAPESLLKNLLYYVGRADKGSDRVAKIHDAYQLEQAEFNNAGSLSESSSDGMNAPDPEAIKSVVVALQEELNTIKHVLDLSLKGQAGVQNLEEVLPVVKRVGDTLAILGIGDLRKKIVEQIALIDEMVENNALDEEQLLKVASKVIDVEHKLEAISKVVGKSNDLSSINEREIEIDDAKATVIVECRNGLERAKDAIIEYISSKWDVSHLENIDQLLRDIRGGLDMIPLPRPAAIMESCNRFIQEDLLSGKVQPSWEKLDALADAMASVEFYLERLSTDLDIDADSLLDIAQDSVELLGYPLSDDVATKAQSDEESELPPIMEVDTQENDQQHEDRSAVSDLSTTESYDQLSQSYDLTQNPDSFQNNDEQDIEPLPQVEVEQAQEQVDLSPAFEQQESISEDPISLDKISVSDESESESDIDDEIIEIFIEEAGEVLETLHENFPKWRADSTDDESLVVIRRAFHTLKGSGRMVEALDIGELAWSVENLLNRVIDKSISYNDSQAEYISRVMKIAPSLISAFENKQPNPDKPLTEHLMKLGGELAEGNVISDFSYVDESLATLGEDHEQPPEDSYIVEVNPEEDIDELEERDSQILSAAEDDSEEDNVLTEIFTSEARSHLQTMNIFVADMKAMAPIFSTPTDALQRALHTLKGSAKMANKMPIAYMTEPLEEFAKELITYQVAIDEDILQLLSDATSYMEAAVDQVEHNGSADIPKLDQFLARLNELRERSVGPLVRLKELEKDGANSVDPRLLSIFMAEEMTLLLDAEALLNTWREHEQSEQPERIDELIKELSTLKEGAHKANLPDMQHLSEMLKQVHQCVKTGDTPLDDNFFDSTIAGHNALLDMVDAVAAGQNVVPASQDISDSLQNLIQHDDSLNTANDESVDYQALSSETNEEQQEEDQSLASQHDIAQFINTDELDQEPADESDSIEEISTFDVTFDSSMQTLEQVDTSDDADSDDGDAVEIEQNDDDANIDITGVELDEDFQTDLSQVLDNSQNLSLENGLELEEDLESDLSDDTTAEGIDEPREYIDIAELAQAESDNENESLSVDEHAEQQDTSEEHLTSEVFNHENELNEQHFEHNSQAEQPDNSEPHSTDEHVESIIEISDDIYDVVDFADPDFDQDIFEVFIEEADELSEELDEAIDQWQRDWSDPKPSDILKRALHTLKGGARLANLDKLGDLTHEYESYIIATKNEDISDVFFKNLQRFQDKVLASIRALHAPTESSNSQSEQVASPTDGEQTAYQEGSDAGSNNVVPFSPKSKTEDDSSQENYSGPVTAAAHTLAQGQAAVKRAGPQEVVKVPADLLEELVNLAGETSISRGRLEQQVTDFGHALEEVDGTILRLQEQIRRLDIETEAQILFRQEQIAESDKNFDPLEMDRYSQLQQLSRSLIESASDLADLRNTLTENVRDTETLLLQQSRINSNLQEGLMRSRMVPFSRMVPRLRRIVRQVATELGKNVTFELDNIEGELDRSVLERMVAPLEHMLRNAVDHGIESPEDRIDAGKSDTGRIVLTLGREGGEVILRLADDGRGINLERVREKAIERNLMAENAELSDLDIMQFILHAGFSTAENVTQISGRGVGMDVVHAEIKQLGGSVSINSQWGKGTEFNVRLPFTVSVNRALMVSLGSDYYAVPLNNIEGIVRVSPFELEHYYQNPDARFEYAGESYQVRYLGAMLSEDVRPKLEGQSLPMPVLLVRSAEHTMALQVDTLMGSREIVVKNLGQQFSSVLGLSGATLMGDGSVVVILDPHALVRKEIALTRPNMSLVASTEALPEPVSDIQTIMVVDDSVTVRKVTTRFLERQGYHVITAKDGVDALRILQDDIPDLMLLDIEMPRMDGFEVAKNVRTTSRWKKIPIIMITSRTGDKHREHAFSLGVNNYLGKPYQEEVLLESITDILGETNQ